MLKVSLILMRFFLRGCENGYDQHRRGAIAAEGGAGVKGGCWNVRAFRLEWLCRLRGHDQPITCIRVAGRNASRTPPVTRLPEVLLHSKEFSPCLAFTASFSLLFFWRPARAGTIRTLDGKNYEGEVKIDPTGVLLVTPHGGTQTRIELSNVLQATIRGDAASAPVKPGNALPAEWKEQNIGNAGPPGSTTYSDSKFLMKGTGKDIGEAADAFHFVYRQLGWECQIIARVASMEGKSARAGVAIREDMNPNSRGGALLVDQPKGVSAFAPGRAGRCNGRHARQRRSKDTVLGAVDSPGKYSQRLHLGRR